LSVGNVSRFGSYPQIFLVKTSFGNLNDAIKTAISALKLSLGKQKISVKR
jgi:hypothetical protein